MQGDSTKIRVNGKAIGKIEKSFEKDVNSEKEGKNAKTGWRLSVREKELVRDRICSREKIRFQIGSHKVFNKNLYIFGISNCVSVSLNFILDPKSVFKINKSE